MVPVRSSGSKIARGIVLALCVSCATVGGLGFFYDAPHVQAAVVSTQLYISVCGDGDPNEPYKMCDDGRAFNTGAYGSTTAQRHCLPDCSGYGPYCGDGVLQVRYTEQCDYGAANGTGGLCSATCQSLPPAPPAGNPTTGSPPVGSIPNTNATPGNVSSANQTEVVLRGKAYPNSTVSILLDGQLLGTVQADSNADFLYTNTTVTPGTETFSFSAIDNIGTPSLMDSIVFEVVQGAITTVANVFLPPTINVSATQIAPGGLLTISGQSVPFANVTTQIDGQASSTMVSAVDTAGNWALQIDTGSITTGNHAAKALFLLGTSTASGFGRSIGFAVGNVGPSCSAKPDMNHDGKVNLVDFSIFLTNWGTSAAQADFNCDSKVNLADFSIMLFNWTG